MTQTACKFAVSKNWSRLGEPQGRHVATCLGTHLPIAVATKYRRWLNCARRSNFSPSQRGGAPILEYSGRLLHHEGIGISFDCPLREPLACATVKKA